MFLLSSPFLRIVTIEADRDGSLMQRLRVYSNWRASEAELQVTSLPLASAVDILVCCGAGRSRFLVASTNGITLYEFDASSAQIVPVLEIAAFQVRHLALHGDFLGWTTQRTAHVLNVQAEPHHEEEAAGKGHRVRQAKSVDVVTQGPLGLA